MRRFYALGVLAATAVAAALGLKVTEARAHPHPCHVETCPEGWKRVLADCDSQDCGYGKDKTIMCGWCEP